MKNLRRRVIYTSFHTEADFLAYYDKMGKFVSLVVDIPGKGYNHAEVDHETFFTLLDKVKTFDDAFPALYKNAKSRTFNGGRPSDGSLPTANFHEIAVNAYGYHDRRWW